MLSTIILPNQLFEINNLLEKDTVIYLYEHPIYFTEYKYHKLKLILHRATMKMYADYIHKKYNIKAKYIEFNDDINIAFKHNVQLYDPVDHDIAKEFKSLAKKNKVDISMYDTPLFLTTIDQLQDYLDNGGKYHQTSFYIWQRKRLNILLTKNDKPVGGKWTYDTSNRDPFPKGFDKDTKFNTNKSKYVLEAIKYVNKHFPDNPGSDNFYLPITFEAAKNQLKLFLKDKLNDFGKYQDAVDEKIIFGCHTVLSPLINIGLLTPKYVVDEIIKYYKQHNSKLESVEGLIRQIIGWRCYVRMVYMFKHKEMNTLNHFNHKNKLGDEWYTAQTNIGPLDIIIKKVLDYGYAHHIERLMYLSNFMLLSEIDPKQVFKWFMIFIDAYPWVMEANVYGMGQHSTGPMIMTRPYFSSSNYIDKMSSYHKKQNIYPKIKLDNIEYEWFEVWDALYYNFINNNKTEFSKNYSLATSVAHWNKKSKGDQDKLLHIAKAYLKNYK